MEARWRNFSVLFRPILSHLADQSAPGSPVDVEKPDKSGHFGTFERGWVGGFVLICPAIFRFYHWNVRLLSCFVRSLRMSNPAVLGGLVALFLPIRIWYGMGVGVGKGRSVSGGAFQGIQGQGSETSEQVDNFHMHSYRMVLNKGNWRSRAANPYIPGKKPGKPGQSAPGVR